MPHPRHPLARRLLGLAEAAAALGLLFTVAGLLGRHHWFLELFTHMKPQLAVCFLLYAGLELAARRRRRAALSLACCAVNALPVLALLLPCRAPAAPAPAPAATLRILQANILTSNTNAAALLRLVRDERPDVIVLQEPNRRWLNQLASLTNDYPVHAALPREDNFGAAIYCRRPAYGAEVLLLGDPEGAPSVRARVPAGGRTLTVVGTHPLAPYNAYTWQGRNRYTLELAQALRREEGPLVLTGDLNNTPWSAHFRDFLAASGLRDSARGRPLQPTWPVFSPPFARIPLDHCFHSADVRVLARRPGPAIGSDHLPLIIDVAF